MPKFSRTSENKLNTCEKDLVTLFKYVILEFDCTVVYGQRTPEVQFELFKKGRVQKNGVWIVEDQREVVTNCDGYKIKSKHNAEPLSLAADVVPYPTLYSDIKAIRHFAGYVLGVADTLKYLGYIDNRIISGIDWDNDRDLHDQNFFDAVHFEQKL